MLNDSMTINELKQGDPNTFERIYRFYYKGLCAFGAQYIPLSDSEEIVQDTMMWIWENRDSLNSNLSLKSLLFTMVKNKALNQLTHEEIRRRVEQEIADKYQESFESPDLYLNKELFTAYRQALHKLPPEFKQAFMMNRHMHLTHKEIAEQIHVSKQTVNYRIGQALKLLRTELKDYLPILGTLLLYELPN